MKRIAVCPGSFNYTFAGVLYILDSALQHYINRVDIACKAHLPVEHFFCLCYIRLMVKADAAGAGFREDIQPVRGVAAYM